MDRKAMIETVGNLNTNIVAKQLRGIKITAPALADWCSVCNKEKKAGHYIEITISNSVFRLCNVDAEKLADELAIILHG